MERIRWTVLLALGLALVATGGTYAATKITGSQIRDGTITGRDVKDRSLTLADLRRTSRNIVRVERTATLAPGDVNSVAVGCPGGRRLVSGGFQSVSADGEVFYADSFGSSTTWAVGLDNFDSPVEGEVTAVAYCSSSGRASIAGRASIPRAVKAGMARMEARLLARRGG